MVILGAGASYDSAALVPPSLGFAQNRPPLADHLFDSRPMFREALAKYRQIHPIMGYLGNRGTRSVEEILQELSEEAPRVSERARQLMAVRYYVREIIFKCCKAWLSEVTGLTTHKTFVDQLLQHETQRVLFVTFNYDTLIEDVLGDYDDLHFKEFKDYTNKSVKFALYKLHGSVDWVRIAHLGRENPPGRLNVINAVANYANTMPGTGFKMQPNIDSDVVDGVFIGVPAIAIPINRKLNFECPEEHVRHLCEMLPRVTKILVIGWQGTESTFTDLLKKHLRHVEKFRVVSVADAPTIMNRLRTALSPALDTAECDWFLEGFTSFVLSKAGVPFLNA